MATGSMRRSLTGAHAGLDGQVLYRKLTQACDELRREELRRIPAAAAADTRSALGHNSVHAVRHHLAAGQGSGPSTWTAPYHPARHSRVPTPPSSVASGTTWAENDCLGGRLDTVSVERLTFASRCRRCSRLGANPRPGAGAAQLMTSPMTRRRGSRPLPIASGAERTGESSLEGRQQRQSADPRRNYARHMLRTWWDVEKHWGGVGFAVPCSMDPIELVSLARQVTGRAVARGDVQLCRWVTPEAAVRMLWPRRAESYVVPCGHSTLNRCWSTSRPDLAAATSGVCWPAAGHQDRPAVG